MLSKDLTLQQLHDAMVRVAARAPHGEKRKRAQVLRMTCALSLAQNIKDNGASPPRGSR